MYYTVAFDVLGHGVAPDTQYIEVLTPSESLYPSETLYPMMNMLATEPDPPEDPDYRFLGWYNDSLMTRRWDFENDPVLHSMTLYAGWERVKAQWTGNRSKEQYTFVKVDWETWQEHETYDYITKGSIEQAADTETKVTASFEFEGYEIPDTKDLIRVYYSFEDDDGLVASEPIATLFVSYANLKYKDTLKGIKASGTLEGSSVLQALDDPKIGMPMTIQKNANAVYEAEQLILDCGLRTELEPSSHNLSADHTFDAGTSYLEMVNWLLETAGYTKAYPDANGIVQLKSYAASQQRKDYTVFANNDQSIMYPEIEASNDWQTSPNVVRLVYNTDEACIAAFAKNVAGSRVSLEARKGREITYFEEVSDIAGVSKANTLKETAEQKLLELSSDVEYVKFEHAYVPIMIYDPVRILYSDMEWAGNADNIVIELAPSTKTLTKVKRILTEDIEINSGAEVYRGE